MGFSAWTYLGIYINVFLSIVDVSIDVWAYLFSIGTFFKCVVPLTAFPLLVQEDFRGRHE